MSNSQPFDPDSVMDAVEWLTGQAGLEALTIRAVARITGVPTAAIYQMYGSREGLIGHAWLRAARRFVELLVALVDDAHTVANPRDEVLAAAETSLIYPRRYPGSGAFRLVVSRYELVDLALPSEVTDQLRCVENEFLEVIARLSVQLWDRQDAQTLEVISACVADLPNRILTRSARYSDGTLREYLRAAVQGILEVGPPPTESNFPIDRELVAAALRGARRGFPPGQRYCLGSRASERAGLMGRGP
ncbi:TetR family transcriptional regulator [Mycobacterium simulans]|uniref:TetR family transcriptional regulator n=1 Tax=Mycobacterium simulans TaxID=627089 RepID=UPI0017493DE6|nr:TetR family transcriptional regulator [Mycobacterium simulans]